MLFMRSIQALIVLAVNRRLTVFTLALLGFLGSTFVTGNEARAGNAHFQAKNMVLLPGLTPAAGAATLTRTDKGIAFRVYTSGLTPGANTVWIVIFNRPEHCASGPGACVGPDLGNPAVEGSIVYGTGSIVGPDGIANFHGSLEEGRPPDGIQVNVPAGTANGLKNSKKAEIHLVVRSHGPTDDMGGAVTQLTTFENGCAVCVEPQGVVFEPVH